MTSKQAPPALPAWLERELPFQRYSVDVGGWPMHVMETGQGRPVVMLHGNPTWGFLWRKVAGELAGAPLRLIMPDLIGLGLSGRPRDQAAHTLDAHVGWFGALLDALALDDLVFVGQDWGGPVGFGALAERPGRCAALVVLNTVIGAPREGFRATAFHKFARLPVVSDVVFRGLGFPQGLLAAAQGDKRSLAPWTQAARAYRWPLRGLARNLAPLALARMVPDSPAHPSIPALERGGEYLRSFAGPIEVVWGERDPVLGRVIGHVERTLPRARVTRTPAGHFLQEEVPREIASAIRAVAAVA